MKRQKVKRLRRKISVPKACYFCTEEKEPTIKDVEVLRRFISERNRIVPRVRNGVCAKHQRHLAVAIKHARHVALLPFV